jgi:hypothetical protein
LLASKAKAIYKPKWSNYALSIRQNLESPYADVAPISRGDGTWRYEYSPEDETKGLSQSVYTNVALLANMKDRVPVAVMRQISDSPSRYFVQGLALVVSRTPRHFILEGFPAGDSQAATVAKREGGAGGETGGAFIAVTDNDWAEGLQVDDVTDNVNFWSPGGKPLRNDLPGHHIFLFAKVKPKEGVVTLGRRVVGCANVVRFQAMSAEEAWRAFGLGNGAASLDEMVRRIGSFNTARSIRPDSSIGCTVLDGVRWFESPVDLAAVSVPWSKETVRGRTISTEEERRILEASRAVPQELSVAVRELNDAFWAAAPRRREVVSQRIERDPAVVRALKTMHPNICQYGGERFFRKKGGRANYSEIHHLKELCKGGLDVTENCLVLCATCHRKMHYGDILIEDLGTSIRITEEGTMKVIPKNRIVLPITVRVR